MIVQRLLVSCKFVSCVALNKFWDGERFTLIVTKARASLLRGLVSGVPCRLPTCSRIQKYA
jgi:hypothetical protein